MKVAILAGGGGTRLAEETEVRPKPMVEIGGRPILWHIMRHYATFGFQDFAVALGYKGEYIKKYMVDYCSLNSDLTVKLSCGSVRRHGNGSLDWTVDLIDTGLTTPTGGRVRRLLPYMDGQTFMLTYGDGLSDIDIADLVAFHRGHGGLATITAVRPPARFGHLEFDGDRVSEFSEKPQTAEGWINGGFFVLEPGIGEYIESDTVSWEHEPLHRLAADGQLFAYRHESFWQCMDTLRDKHLLQSLWDAGEAPWRAAGR